MQVEQGYLGPRKGAGIDAIRDKMPMKGFSEDRNMLRTEEKKGDFCS